MLDKKAGRLRTGLTTGTCAAAAAAAAATALLGQKRIDTVRVTLPGGGDATLEARTLGFTNEEAQCQVVKDAGDDADATDGLAVRATVSKADTPGVRLKAGEGVGTVTKPGLTVAPGEPAINPVPRGMIARAVRGVCRDYSYDIEANGLDVEISIPDGERIAQRTLNPQLGIVGGLSVLGTTGIVHPMSREAFADSLRLELRQALDGWGGPIALVPGNYGCAYAEGLGVPGGRVFRFSNFLGSALDELAHHAPRRILLIGDIGKLVKVAGGVFATHSSDSDARMEIIAAYAALLGAGADCVGRVLSCPTTAAALEALDAEGLTEQVCALLAERVKRRCERRLPEDGGFEVEAILFSQGRGRLAATDGADGLVEELRRMV